MRCPCVLGYARVSTGDQDLAGQILRLTAAGATKMFEDVVSGKRVDRPGLTAFLDYAPGLTHETYVFLFSDSNPL